jgi:RES domain-containing protein
MSGAGASKHGGRANRPGVEALYLSLEYATAIHEYQQASSLLPPGTLGNYAVSAEPVIDFTKGFSKGEWDSIWEGFYCDWRALWFDKHIEPPSWIIGDLAIASGAKGILFKSMLHPSGTNLVLFNGALTANDVLRVNDPLGALPKTTASWD